MYNIFVAPEPNDSRAIYRWHVAAEELLATGIALTEEGAWAQARAAAEESAA
jgi:hypothetical protein